MSDRTLDPVRRQQSTNIRHRRWYARQKEKRLAAEAAAKAAHRAALDAVRVSRGLLPKADADREKVRKFREKQAEMKVMISQCWFAPSLTNAEFDQHAKEHGWDASQAQSRFASFNRVAAVCEVNVNPYLLQHYGQGAEDSRLRFHEAWLQTQDIPKALELAKTMKVEFKGRNGVEIELGRQRRFADARERWSDGSEILSALLGRGASRVQSE